ncbi:phospholipase C [Anseongella ginsenosidimutans]|uniref:Phospholipase C n=1 Tax=Anseongella ginsenosidimutans TaxID=496056 RepID=A0A4R3KV73_9SPHI|nr:phospholipase C, phosphocholine-specific [Anseongella ginsenosidimutans]QEC51646.1 phospholipase C, phosphocholine-specific [Anseongella ginsenosidimutans]TCS88981.1 phospholipase C [Anseongella ginsenosidimutans]
MDATRREFIRQASLLAGGVGIWDKLPASIKKAFEIDPGPGTTFYDAEHIVVLMQENRSFDHSFGTLQGVRGFNDPRALRQPGGNKVWLQRNKAGETYAPFRLNIKDTRATWMGSLPHSWPDMTDARNSGKMDQWLEAKKPGNKDFEGMPLTMGYYNREDLPFYYALADAFTVCDQYFCSSLTGTTPNRLYLWSGTIRDEGRTNAPANVRNSDVTYEKEASWRAFPELLERHGVSWRIYQNELSLDTGLSGEEEAWLANFTDNPIEWFTQYHVRYSAAYLRELSRKAEALGKELRDLEEEREYPEKEKEYREKEALLGRLNAEISKWSPENFAKLDETARNIHRRAFTTNENDPNYHRLKDLAYEENGEERNTSIPAGDVLHRFREDVKNKQLPAVSWLVAPERFSDHPGSPWYGAWYISEVMDILTGDPETWKKTIFLITYDENDGYFDHVAPFVPPVPGKKHTGKVSEGIDTKTEYVSLEEEIREKGENKEDAREGPIGLGFRVPMIVASPWSRGGRVNSQVFDHTSVLQFMESFFSKKTGKALRETNISAWRRTVCGNLQSAFMAYGGEKIDYPAPVNRQAFIKSIYNAKFRQLPSGYKTLSAEAIDRVNRRLQPEDIMPAQEPGIRDACALPYQLAVNGRLEKDRQAFTINFQAGNSAFGKEAAGAPFLVYAPGSYLAAESVPGPAVYEKCRNWAYAVTAGDKLADTWPLGNFGEGVYELEVYGPNGFFRSFRGTQKDPLLLIEEEYVPEPRKAGTLADSLRLKIRNFSAVDAVRLTLSGKDYGMLPQTALIPPGAATLMTIDTGKSYGWYDLRLTAEGYEAFEQRLAGRVETGGPRKTDPVMGRTSV